MNLEGDRSPLDELPPPDSPTIFVRSARLPVGLRTQSYEGPDRGRAKVGGEGIENALRVLLRALFAKEDFLEGQLDALIEVIEGRDCAVLLPTGGGKSLIYQLAGLCLPGRTLVVDPLVSLMEDQVRGLEANGIDRVALLSSFQTRQGRREAVEEQIAAGEALFTFVSPERLQQSGFRTTLQASVRASPVNLCVVDEAHCVSEWGHDFRTSYLHLGRILRDVCAATDGTAPPILALTGTASRAVLRDVLIELGIERDSERAVVRPKSFDRAELHYSIEAATPDQAEGALTGALRALPRRLGVPDSDFFRPRGDRTQSGIVFCPNVNGKYGVVDVANEIRAVIGRPPAIYSGKPPRGRKSDGWDHEKRRNADAFKGNEAPILVSTKAFGMGIDKPNVRYVMHYGIPGSIESYYQEVGRAGRDRGDAECILVLVEYDGERDRRMLSEDTNLEETRGLAEVKRREADDVTRQLFFHLSSFRGVDREVGDIEALVGQIPGLGEKQVVEVPMDAGGDRQDQERAIFRLAVLGVVDDYLVEWGSRRFDVHMASCEAGDVVNALLTYVGRSTPGRRETLRASLPDDLEELTLEGTILLCTRLLIEYVYDTIERSRRRSLREMWLAARESRTNPEEEFRQRILDYLSQGDVAPVLERLAEQDHVELADWFEPLEQVAPGPDAAELRGNAARLLTSFPDHPGMLLARAWAEVRDPRGDLREFRSNLVTALESGRDRYGLEPADFDPLAEWLARECAGRGGAQVAAVEAFLLAGMESQPLNDLVVGSLVEPGADPQLRRLALTRSLRQVAADMGETVARYEPILTEPQGSSRQQSPRPGANEGGLRGRDRA